MTSANNPQPPHSDYPPFCASLYSFDVFLPIIDLHQEDHWLPSTKKPTGWLYWLYLWFHIGAGWALTSVLVAALSGLIKKD